MWSRCSELMIRFAEEKKGNILPIRYLYQDRDAFFLEEPSVILDIVNNARANLKMTTLTQEQLDIRLSSLDGFFNLRLFSHIISSEMYLPDEISRRFKISPPLPFAPPLANKENILRLIEFANGGSIIISKIFLYIIEFIVRLYLFCVNMTHKY